MQDVIIRAAITLKLSNFEETGGIVAGHTTNIPEARIQEPSAARYLWQRHPRCDMFFDRRLPATGDAELFNPTLGVDAARLAFEPDAGIWEYRGRSRHAKWRRILDVAGKAVSSPADVSKEIADLHKAGKHTVLMRVKSNNGIKFVAIPFGNV